MVSLLHEPFLLHHQYIQVDPSSPKHSPLIPPPNLFTGDKLPSSWVLRNTFAYSSEDELRPAKKMSLYIPVISAAEKLNMLLVAKWVLKQALNLSWKTALAGAPWKEEEWSPNYEFGGSNQTHRCELPLQPTFGKIGIILAGIFLNWALVRMGK